MPPNAFCSWVDNNKIYILKKRVTPRPSRDPEGDVVATRLPDYWGLFSCGVESRSECIFAK